MNLSYLFYSTYKKCPAQYRWSFVDKPPVFVPRNMRYAFLGLVMQRLVELFYINHWWTAKEGPITRMRIALPSISQQTLESNNIEMTTHELEEWMKIIHDTVPRIIEVVKREKFLSEECYVEREEEVPLGDDKLWMKPDLIVIRKGVTTLLDGKGGKTVGRYIDPDQLIFYALAVEKVWGRLPHRIGFWWYRHSRVVWYPKLLNHVEMDRVRTNARNYIDGIKVGKFEPTPGQHCRLCDHRIHCEVGQKFIEERHRNAEVFIPDNFSEVDF